MPNLLISRYGLKIVLYKAKVFFRDVFVGGRGAAKKRARFFSVLAVVVIVGLIASISIYGFNLRGGAQGTKISAIGDYYLGNYDTTESGLGWRTRLLPNNFKPTNIYVCNGANSNYGGYIYMFDQSSKTIKKIANDTNFLTNPVIDVSPPTLPSLKVPYRITCGMVNLAPKIAILTEDGKLYHADVTGGAEAWLLLKKGGTDSGYNLLTDSNPGIGGAANLIDFSSGYQENAGNSAHYHLLSSSKAVDWNIVDYNVASYDITGLGSGELPAQMLTVYANFFPGTYHYRYIMTDKSKLYRSYIGNANMSFVADYKTPSSYNTFKPDGTSGTISENISHFSIQIPLGQYQSLYTQSNKLGDGIYANFFNTQEKVHNAPDTEIVDTRYQFIGCKPVSVNTRSWGGSAVNNKYTAIFGAGCADPTAPVVPPGTGSTTINNTYNYEYRGVSIHTKAETLDPSTGMPRGDATVKKGTTNQRVRFTLTINNPDAQKKVDAKFTLPNGFLYNGIGGANTISYSGINCAAPATVSVPAIGINGPMSWNQCVAQLGDSTIVFEALAP